MCRANRLAPSSGWNGVGITDAARLLGITVPAVNTRHQGARLKMAHSLAALASKARSCADIIQPDIIQANQGAIVAQGAAILE
jgi:hypothetical protein